MSTLHEDVRMSEEAETEAAYAMRELYVTEKTCLIAYIKQLKKWI